MKSLFYSTISNFQEHCLNRSSESELCAINSLGNIFSLAKICKLSCWKKSGACVTCGICIPILFVLKRFFFWCKSFSLLIYKFAFVYQLLLCMEQWKIWTLQCRNDRDKLRLLNLCLCAIRTADWIHRVPRKFFVFSALLFRRHFSTL